MSKNPKTDLPGADLLFGMHSKTSSVPAPTKEEKNPVESINPLKDESLEPIKFTFYFDPKTLDDLEVAKFRLRMERRVRVSKSDIVNASLKHCMKDLVFLERLVQGQID